MTEIELNNGPIHKIPKEIKSDGDAKHCPTCDANTFYETGCIVCHYQQSKS